MKVSTRVEYGVLALTDIALHSENGSSVSAIEISKRQGISKKYLEQILPLLKQAGLIKAQKGLGGGYMLSCKATNIKMSDVLDALDNTILEDIDNVPADGQRELARAVNEFLWEKLNGLLRSFTEGMSLFEFVQKCADRVADGWDMYVI
ncbi:MAG: Rrf2 family transcriptional regulator [Lachnospiraceae bacterium]|nr:Rrf2 family transcriptional regulator [Lachnospiraceae bacterium]